MHQVPKEHQQAFDEFIAGPAKLRTAVAGLTASGVSQRAPGDEWSIRDIVTHVADAELVRATRIRFMIAEDAPVLPGWDEEQWKRRLQYLWRDVDGSLALFELLRYSTAELVAHAGKSGWERTGVASEELITVRDLVDRGVEHVTAHVAQVAAIRQALKA